MQKIYFNPGCALMLYKEDLALKVFAFLKSQDSSIQWHSICCHHNPQVENDSLIINICAGCDRRFSKLYEGVTTISLWEYLASNDNFVFPDHSGLVLSIHDACPIRHKSRVHKAIRILLKKMNIEVRETEQSQGKSVCCGDSLYPKVDLAKIKEHMINRAQAMPCDDVCVYCVSCIKSMYIGGKTPRYLVDLLFNEETSVGEYDTVKWHEQVQSYIDEH